MKEGGKAYFASDFHLGLRAGGDPSGRERRVVSWLERCADDASSIWLLGDIFDFWWEYRLVVPKGFTRFLGALSRLTDSGITVHYLTGNHDMWMGGYLEDECGVRVRHGIVREQFNGHRFLLAHGEGLGTGESRYRLLLALFRNRFLRALYSSIHPRIGVAIGHRWSLRSRLGRGEHTPFLGAEHEDLINYSKLSLESEHTDYFIYGHRHLALMHRLGEKSRVVLLGDWIGGESYAVWNGKEIELIGGD